jgi:hypothetical protein
MPTCEIARGVFFQPSVFNLRWSLVLQFNMSRSGQFVRKSRQTLPRPHRRLVQNRLKSSGTHQFSQDVATCGQTELSRLDSPVVLQYSELTDALLGYARRAQQGAEDAALVAGTGKDLLEAIAAHVLMTMRGGYPTSANFQALLGMAFIALDLAVPEIPEAQGESPIRAMERGLFATALGVSRVRNKQGTSHGRPWIPTLTDAEAKAAIESVGTVASYLLAKLATHKR